MEAFPAIALISGDPVLIHALPAQIAHRYGTLPAIYQHGAPLPAETGLILFDCAVGTPDLATLPADAAIILLAAGDGAAETTAATQRKPMPDVLPRPVSVPLLIRFIDQWHTRPQNASSPRILQLAESVHFHPIEKRVEKNGRSVDITDKETALLACLYQHRQGWLARETLLEDVWGYDNSIDTHTLETHLYRLRTKLRTLLGEMELIQTRQGSYRLNPDIP